MYPMKEGELPTRLEETFQLTCKERHPRNLLAIFLFKFSDKIWFESNIRFEAYQEQFVEFKMCNFL
jgi:hypothetical protein